METEREDPMKEIIAERLADELDPSGLPYPEAWRKAKAVTFCTDWRGGNPDPQRETEAKILWSAERLFIQFRCRFRGIYVYGGGNRRRDRLWERDVAEIFIRPGNDDQYHYKEFEVSPNGDWLDLDINRGEKSLLLCDLRSRVSVDFEASIWTAVMGIPFSSLCDSFDPQDSWRLNLFRIEGEGQERFYSAWIPTHTSRPNFHVPEVFGTLRFVFQPEPKLS